MRLCSRDQKIFVHITNGGGEGGRCWTQIQVRQAQIQVTLVRRGFYCTPPISAFSETAPQCCQMAGILCSQRGQRVSIPQELGRNGEPPPRPTGSEPHPTASLGPSGSTAPYSTPQTFRQSGGLKRRFLQERKPGAGPLRAPFTSL